MTTSHSVGFWDLSSCTLECSQRQGAWWYGGVHGLVLLPSSSCSESGDAGAFDQSVQHPLSSPLYCRPRARDNAKLSRFEV